MKILKWTLSFILIVVVIAVVALGFARNALITKGATKAIEESTGFRLDMAKFNIGVFKPEFEILGLKLKNPPDFPDEEGFEINRFYARYELLSLLTEEIHFYELEIDVPKVVIVQKEDGETNIGRLSKKSKEMGDKGKEAKEKKSGDRAPEPRKPKKPRKAKKEKGFRIDTLTVKLGEAEMRTFEEGKPEPEIEVFKIDKEQTFTDVTSAEDVINQVVAEVLASHLMKGMSQWSEDHEEDLDKLGLKKEDMKKVEEGLKSFFKGFQ